MTGKAGEEGPIRPKHGTHDTGHTDHTDHTSHTDHRNGTNGAESGTDAPGRDADVAVGAPVFVDPSGRRAHRMRRAGWLVAAACVCSTATLGLAVAGGDSTAPWLRIPGVLEDDTPDRGTEVAPRPERTESVAPAADSPAVAGPRPGTTTAAETAAGSRGNGDGADTAAGGPSSTGPSPAGGTAPPSADGGDGTEAAAGRPGRATPSGGPSEPAAEPGSAGPASSAPPAVPSPGGTPATGILDGVAEAVSGLFGG